MKLRSESFFLLASDEFLVKMKSFFTERQTRCCKQMMDLNIYSSDFLIRYRRKSCRVKKFLTYFKERLGELACQNSFIPQLYLSTEPVIFSENPKDGENFENAVKNPFSSKSRSKT